MKKINLKDLLKGGTKELKRNDLKNVLGGGVFTTVFGDGSGSGTCNKPCSDDTSCSGACNVCHSYSIGNNNPNQGVSAGFCNE